MRATPVGWDDARDGLYRMGTMVSIAGEEYGESDIMSVSTRAALYSGGTASIGGCVAREIDLVVKPRGTIPRMAEIKVYTKPISETYQTEWLQKGTYYIDTRQIDRVTGILTIHGYDAMLKAEQPFLTETTEDDWPKPMDEVVEEIAKRMGVTVDSRTVISHTMTVGFPLGYTMREILGHIAVAHAGNWTITDVGELRLVGLTEFPEETNYLVTERGDVILFGTEKIIV